LKVEKSGAPFIELGKNWWLITLFVSYSIELDLRSSQRGKWAGVMGKEQF
jgi:hypothetical protein